ncbi:MAG TPA: T9SS type A sorting domain-containing protein [Ignavibacteriaceae bacterium]|nr:T9SS type A sorting domain-containing protein [Ignavibacteriaceae bacterium]
MKKFIFLLAIPLITFAQPDIVGEFIIYLDNYGTSWNVTITMTAIGARWDENFELTEQYQYLSLNAQNNPNQTQVAFDHILDPGDNPEYALGLYKISAIENGIEQAYFWMDWRTSSWGEYPDIVVNYDVGENTFKNTAGTQVLDFSYRTFWEFTENSLITSNLENYWENCLCLIHDADFHPKLVWGTYPDENFSVQYYKIYKKTGTGNFIFAQTNSGICWLDDSEVVIIGSPQANETICYYKITAVGWQSEESVETDYSNIVDTRVQGTNQDKIGYGSNNCAVDKFELNQNYPNPFNPTTLIRWHSPVDEFVTIQVIDILGRQVALLVNEFRKAGSHYIEFDASKLTSGIYIYNIKIGNYSASRKLVLQK